MDEEVVEAGNRDREERRRLNETDRDCFLVLFKCRGKAKSGEKGHKLYMYG